MSNWRYAELTVDKLPKWPFLIMPKWLHREIYANMSTCQHAKMLTQSEPTDLTGYVSPFLSRTGIRMPVRLELYRHTYACTTGVIQAYVCLYDWSYTGIRTSTNEYSVKLFWPLIGWSTYACLTRVVQAYVCLYNSSRTGIRMPV